MTVSIIVMQTVLVAIRIGTRINPVPTSPIDRPDLEHNCKQKNLLLPVHNGTEVVENCSASVRWCGQARAVLSDLYFAS
jgi:hypothetical protein